MFKHATADLFFEHVIYELEHLFMFPTRLLPLISRKLLNCKMDNSNRIKYVESRIIGIERNINTLTAEVKDLKNILNELRSSQPQDSKKRKLSTKLIDSPDHSPGLQKDVNHFTKDADGYVHVYTDGACENNGKSNAKAGLGVWFGPDHPLNAGEPVKRRPTNNVGEIEACTRAIQIAHGAGIKKLLINTDSEFTINCITKWIHGWKKKNWVNAAGKPVINKDELMELEQNLKLMEDIKWKHVRGHHGIQGNEAADFLARKGAALYTM